jgi:hypothetical protein
MKIESIEQESHDDNVSVNNSVEMYENFLKEQILALINDLCKIDGNLNNKKEEIKNMTYEQLQSELNNCLVPHSKNINSIIKGTGKTKSKELNFLKSLTLFGIQFKSFNHENKNTKKTIVKYFHNILMILDLQNGELPNIPGIKDLPENFQKLMGNEEIMKLAEDVSKDIEQENINPMDIMTGLMSGNLLQNSKISGLIENIAGKLDNKIKNGEIDLSQLGLNLQNLKF